MEALLINSQAVPVRAGGSISRSHYPISKVQRAFSGAVVSTRAISPGSVRSWEIQTSLMDREDALDLIEMLTAPGDVDIEGQMIYSGQFLIQARASSVQVREGPMAGKVRLRFELEEVWP